MKELDRPFTTLFLVSSVDGKISSGDTDDLDADRDWCRIAGVREGLDQYYRLERQTDLFSLNSGRVMAKIGVNRRAEAPEPLPVTFVIIDNQPHLTKSGVRYLSQWGKRLILVTTCDSHPVFGLCDAQGNVEALKIPRPVDFKDLFIRLKTDLGIDRLTVQSGGELNGQFLRAGLIDRVSLVVAPLLVGGRTTPSIADGEALHTVDELSRLRVLSLCKCRELEHSYIYLEYRVLPETIVT